MNYAFGGDTLFDFQICCLVEHKCQRISSVYVEIGLEESLRTQAKFYIPGFFFFFKTKGGQARAKAQEIVDHLASSPSNREEISRLGIKPPTSSLRFGYPSSIIQQFRDRLGPSTNLVLQGVIIFLKDRYWDHCNFHFFFVFSLSGVDLIVHMGVLISCYRILQLISIYTKFIKRSQMCKCCLVQTITLTHQVSQEKYTHSENKQVNKDIENSKACHQPRANCLKCYQ